MNTVHVLRDDVDLSDGSRWAMGSILTCIRNLNVIAVVDPAGRQVVWQWGTDVLEHPHHPTVLPNGHLLVFDNGAFRQYSRIIELDPGARKIVWTYEADPRAGFYSFKMGGAGRPYTSNSRLNCSASRVLGNDSISPLWQEFVRVQTSPVFYADVVRVFGNHAR